MPALAKTLSLIWSKQNQPNKLNLLIASTIRNQNTYGIFLEKIGNDLFNCKILN